MPDSRTRKQILSHRTPGRRLAWIATACLLAIAVGVPAVSAQLERDYYADDPLGLIDAYNQTAFYTTLPVGDTVEVFICYPHAVNATIGEIVQVLNDSDLSQYWNSVSGGRYQVTFHPGTTIAPPGGQVFCHAGAKKASSDRYRAALIIGPVGGVAIEARRGVGSVFVRYPNPDDRVFGVNSRHIKIIEWVEGHQQGWVEVIAIKLAWTLGFPYSYTGVLDENDAAYQADNPMDFLSDGLSVEGSFDVGTIAVNRYAAGWIDPEDVHIYQGGTQRVRLRAGWEQGTQMLVVPSGEQGHFLSLGTRVAKHYDRGIPKEGVESYIVDQRSHQCDHIGSGPPFPCGLNARRQIPYPHVTTTIRNPLAETYNIPDDIEYSALTDPTKHVSQPGDSFTWNDVTITVLRRVGDSYEVEITDGTATVDWFTDDDGNTHEADINRIAQLGIARGCATTPQPKYCPEGHVTRAEMAAFLLRAIGEPDPQPTVSNAFEDVTDSVWYTNYVLRFAQLGVDTGSDGVWRPNDPLTRLEMAEWLTRMFDHITPANSPQGLFGDVNNSNWSIVEGLYEAGVTKGCSTTPLLYCPDEPVTRAQMASFIIRALP